MANCARAAKVNKTAARSGWKRIFTPLCHDAFALSWMRANAPTNWCKDCVVARRCKLFLGAELERCAMVLEAPFLWPAMERRRESCVVDPAIFEPL